MNQIMKRKNLLFKETHPYRYHLLYRGQILVFAGYCIVTLETLIAIKLGLTQITYRETLFISSSVLLVTIILFSIIAINKKLLVWQEWMIFSVDMVFYLIFFCLWVFLMGNLRILGLLSSLIAITIVLSYTNFIQSLFMSASTFICYFGVIYYAIAKAGQYGSLERESFLAFCLAPAFLLIALAAKTIDNSKRKLQSAKRELEIANLGLKDLNSSLKREQSMAEIEMELAHDIQAALFPNRPPVVKDWDIAFTSRPRSGVSGDFYDFYTAGDTLEGLSLFDVSGHGVAPALVTILSKPVLFRNFKKLSSGKTAGIIDSANSDLMEQLEDINTYITGILLRMRDNYIEYVNAGHPDILLLRNSSGSVKVVTDPHCRFKGKPLGITSHKSQYCSLRFSVSYGDSILMFTDGLTEGRNSIGLPFGRERVEIAFAESYGMNASATIEHIMKRFNEFTEGETPSDDITIIAARRI